MNLKVTIPYCCSIWLLAININIANCQCINATTTMSTSLGPYTSKPGIQHVLSRRKRYLLFPPGASFVATMSFAKALATDNPRGVNFVVETDFYYPMYSSISDLFPKDKKSSTVATTTTTIPPTPMWENAKFDSYPGSYFDTGDAWKRKDSNRYSSYNGKEYIPLSPSNMYWQSSKSSSLPLHKSYPNYVSKPIYNSPGTYMSKHQDFSWRQRELYRSRRHLYNHIEKVAEKHGLEIKMCIHRMICEGRHYLLPPGVSFFQDVLRILLTLPVTDDVGDGYSEAMRATEDECLSIYGEKCPYSIVGYILHSQQELNK